MAIILDGTAGITTPAETTTGNESVGGNLSVTGTVSVGGSTMYPLVSGTAVASTSGTSLDFLSIPAWVKRITVLFSGVSTNGTSAVLVQIGSGSVTTTGYISTSNNLNQSNSTGGTSSTAGFIMQSNDASFVRSGVLVLHLITGNSWVASHTMKLNTSQVILGGGDVALSGTLDRVRITTVSGTDTFDAGTVNLLWE